jgi:uncharacterized protein with GYD domain
MPHYLLQVAYTPEAWATLLKNPQNRTEALRPVIERLGGRLHGAWLAFGEYDAVVVIEMPDNVSAAAFGMAVAGGGALKAVKTTPLITPEEGVEAMRKGAGASYKPPGG